MNRFAVGSSMPGHLPDSDPYLATDAEDARAALLDEMTRDAEDAFAAGSEPLAHALDEACVDLRYADTSQGYSVTVTDPERDHDLGRAYWMEPA